MGGPDMASEPHNSFGFFFGGFSEIFRGSSMPFYVFLLAVVSPHCCDIIIFIQSRTRYQNLIPDLLSHHHLSVSLIFSLTYFIFLFIVAI